MSTFSLSGEAFLQYNPHSMSNQWANISLPISKKLINQAKKSRSCYKKGKYDQVPHLMGAQFYLYRRWMEPRDSTLTIRH